MQNAAHAYLQTQVTTTDQGDILIMLYDGAIKFLNSAKERIAAKDPAGKGILISKAMDIINELDSTLNMERGGDLSKNLHNLYGFCTRRLLMANLKQSPEMVDEVIKVLAGLRSAYAQILSTPEAKMAAEEAGKRTAAQSTRTQTAPAPTEQPAAVAVPGLGRHAMSSYGRQNMTPVAGTQAQPAVEEAESPQPVAVPGALPQAFTPATPQVVGSPMTASAAQQGLPGEASTLPPSMQQTAAGAPQDSSTNMTNAQQAAPTEASTAPMPPSFAPRNAAGLSMYRKFAGQ